LGLRGGFLRIFSGDVLSEGLEMRLFLGLVSGYGSFAVRLMALATLFELFVSLEEGGRQ